MVIDILLLAIVVYGIYRGWTKGLIHSVFSMVGWLLGIILAFKFCTLLAPKVGEWFNSKAEWVPMVTFIFIMVCVIVVVLFIGKAVEKIFDITHLSIVNKIAGAVLSCAVLFFVFCEVVGAMNQGNMISESVKQQSKLYFVVEKVQPVMIDGVSTVLPFAKTFMIEMKDKMNEYTDTKNISPLVNQLH